MIKFRIFLLFGLFSLFFSGPLLVHAQEPTPATGISAPVPPETLAAEQPAEETLSAPQPNALRLPPLKAVIVVGPLDGTTNSPGPVTTREINAAEKAAVELEANGVSVSRFYAPNTNWAQIQTAANGAHFFMYRGHGIYWGPLPNPPVGGMGLNERIYSNDDIRAGLRLAPNAIVMIYSCFSSGSSDTDTAPITAAEARRRIDEYSAPYFDLGASAVLTNWYGDAFQMYIRYLFQGMTIGNAFKSFYDYDPAMASLGMHPTRPGLDFWMEYENWNPYPIPPYQYDSSLVGKAGATLENLFAPSMQLSADDITVLVNPNATSQNFNITVQSSWNYTFTWNASDPVNWINTTPPSGPSGSPFTVQVIPGTSTGTYDADVTVSTNDPLIMNKSVPIHVRLIVTNTIHRVYIPAVRR